MKENTIAAFKVTVPKCCAVLFGLGYFFFCQASRSATINWGKKPPIPKTPQTSKLLLRASH